MHQSHLSNTDSALLQIHMACQCGHLETMKFLVDKCNVDPNSMVEVSTWYWMGG